ncbi:Phospholipase-like protein [Corchorus capsularis]|uniref:Phospholipase-like protein n=1 Tax=Corchorus capsularis TaxID=210143 RepID=A0A1R3GFU8_COCAP|nr:Phospholipase-like protein [Corchorus capsularis]
MKKKASLSKAPAIERRVTRSQTKMRVTRSQTKRKTSLVAAAQTPAESSTREVVDLVCTQGASSPLQISGSESISSLKGRNRLQEDQNSPSNTSAGIRALLCNFPDSVSTLAAPPMYVQSDATLGDKTIEFNASSEGASRKENSNSQHVEQNQGRNESDQDAPPLVTPPEDVRGAAGAHASATVASNTSLGRQIPVEEARVGSKLAKDHVFNTETNDESPTKSYSFGLTEMALLPGNVSHDQDEVQSDLLVSIRGYRVKEAYASILGKVIEKHGAMNCIMKSERNRSRCLEKVCKIVQTLQTTKLLHITDAEVTEMLRDVIDLGAARVNVGWLQQNLEHILEVKELVNQSSPLKECKDRNLQIIEESRKTLKRCEDLIPVYEDKLQKLKEKVTFEKEKIDAARAINRNIHLRFSKWQPTVKHFIEESLHP